MEVLTTIIVIVLIIFFAILASGSTLQNLIQSLSLNFRIGIFSGILGSVFNLLNIFTYGTVFNSYNIFQYLSLFCWGITLFCSLFGTNRLLQHVSVNLRVGITSFIFGIIFGTLNIFTYGTSLSNYSMLFSYLYLFCFGVTLLCLLLGINGLFRNISLNLRVGIFSLILGTIFTILSVQTYPADYIINQSLNANLVFGYLSLLFYMLTLLCFLFGLFKLFFRTGKKEDIFAYEDLDSSENSGGVSETPIITERNNYVSKD